MTTTSSPSGCRRRNPKFAPRRQVSVRQARVVAAALAVLSSCAGDDAATGATSLATTAEANVDTTSPPTEAVAIPAAALADRDEPIVCEGGAVEARVEIRRLVRTELWRVVGIDRTERIDLVHVQRGTQLVERPGDWSASAWDPDGHGA